MTQSFVHCTHLAVFGYYYPPHFRNWFSDDWATQVYGRANTFWRKDVEVCHEPPLTLTLTLTPTPTPTLTLTPRPNAGLPRAGQAGTALRHRV